MEAAIVGAGVMGLTLATELLERGFHVRIYERSKSVGEQACSWFAGGMLAPWCEYENADEQVLHNGKGALSWWQRHLDGSSAEVVKQGTLVLAQTQDRQELTRFSRRTENYQWLQRDDIQALEPDVSDKFRQGLYFAEEGHLNPRSALVALAAKIQTQGGEFCFDKEVEPQDLVADAVIDCRGLSAKVDWSDLRGVKGEMLLLHSEEITLQRPVRLLHPRIPLYIVPRENQQFMLGASMIESSTRNGFSVRSMFDLLSAAYALHPVFAEAHIIEMGVDARPSLPNNLPNIQRDKQVWCVNGLYRHGFLLSPSMAIKTADMILRELGKEEEICKS